MENFESYLNARYRPSTARRYLREWQRFSARHQPQKAGRMEVLSWIDSLRRAGHSSGSLNASLAGIKAGFAWLNRSGKRKDHPCAYLLLKDTTGKEPQLQDLFSADELETLLQRKERYGLLRRKNQLMISLLIYQGVTRRELCQLRLKDLDLEKGKIEIGPTSRTHSRRLELRPIQLLLLLRYIEKDRPVLLNGRKSDMLIITKSGTDETGDGISYLFETMKGRFAGRKLNAKTVRMSVIANWLASGLDLRKVQYMAGHKYPSSTARYRISGLEKLTEAVAQFHPLQ